MLKAIVLTIIYFAAVSAFGIIQDEQGEQFYLVPLHRQRRQTSVDISKEADKGVQAGISHEGKIFDNGVHRLDGGAFASKEFRPSGPGTAGGHLDYTHIPSDSHLNVAAQHTQKQGTEFSATGNANLWQQGNSRLDAVGSYGRHFGGQFGSGKPNYYGGLQFTHRF